MHAAYEDPTTDEATKRSLCGIIANFMADLTNNVGASEIMDRALCSTALDLVLTLLDVKTSECGGLSKMLVALEGALRPVEARANKAHYQSIAHTRALDRKIHHTASNVAGPI